MSAVISIFDDSSREGSENSQDDEQFRARREFLKSGLPESFRKQIAKAAATKEAYSLPCSSFTPVTHIRQQPNGEQMILIWMTHRLQAETGYQEFVFWCIHRLPAFDLTLAQFLIIESTERGVGPVMRFPYTCWWHSVYED